MEYAIEQRKRRLVYIAFSIASLVELPIEGYIDGLIFTTCTFECTSVQV